ncbi:MAG: GGDEF domain-containing protein, partial [Pseudomonas sp.]|uniref:GGDEF domain-containing protein n=1 Tax=Pseudomonas sp. TaxID=306 RepID=UPI0030F36495
GFSLERETLVTRLQATNTELATLALTDALTGLYNRRAVMSEVKRLLALAKREGRYVVVGMVDLDGFKSINDTYGHQSGDTFLREVSSNLQICLRASDVLGRTGGDEFVVIAMGVQVEPAELPTAMRNAALQLQERLTSATIGRYALDNGELRYAGASVGVVALMPDGVDAEEAIKLADREMYKVKQRRKSLQVS